MVNKETVCAVVVTYNRKELLLECLEALLKQTYFLDAIYLIDNASNDGTREILKERGYVSAILRPTTEPLESEHSIKMSPGNNLDEEVKVHYVRMHQNVGGAGGFYEGVKRGYNKGYDWLWLMDDDSEPYEDSLMKLFSNLADINGPIAGCASLKLDRENKIQQVHRGYLQKDVWKVIPLTAKEYADSAKITKIGYSSFVGFLISRKAIAKIGFPDKDLFIWGDDLEYCGRLEEYGPIYLIKDSRIKHKDKLEQEYRGFDFDKKSDLWKRYYGTRNRILLYIKFRANTTLIWFELTYFFLRDLKSIVLHYNFKFLRLRLLIISYWHGIGGIKGIRILPENWIKRYPQQ